MRIDAGLILGAVVGVNKPCQQRLMNSGVSGYQSPGPPDAFSLKTRFVSSSSMTNDEKHLSWILQVYG